MEVVAPAGQTDQDIAAYIHRRRRWVHDETERLSERIPPESPLPLRWVIGAKVLYRGRRVRLDIERFEGRHVEISMRGRLNVRLPSKLDDEEASEAIRIAFERWARERVREDVHAIVRRNAPRVGVEPRGVRIRAQKHLWGSCGRDQILHINWHLIFAPVPVLEYAVVHELCHLRERSHDPAFWQMLTEVMPDYEARKAWLEQNGLCCEPTPPRARSP